MQYYRCVAISAIFESAGRRRGAQEAWSAAAGREAIAYAGQVEALLVLVADLSGLFLALCEVRADLGLVTQVACDHRVDISQGRGVLLDNLLGSRAASKAATTVSRVTRVPPTRITPSVSVRIGTGSRGTCSSMRPA